MTYEYFKFTDRRFLPKLTEEGLIRFGHINYYRLLEHVFSEDSLADANEGRSITVAPPIAVGPGEWGTPRGKALTAMGLGNTGEGSVILYGGAKTVCISDCYIFCFSQIEKEPDQLMPLLPTGFNYDGCIKINDPNMLKNVIETSGIIHNGPWEGKPVSDFFDVDWAPITYVDSTVFNIYEVLEPKKGDYFTKLRIPYEKQKEARFVLIPKSKERPDFFEIRINSPEKYFNEINFTGLKPIPYSSINPDEAFNNIKNIIKCLNQIDELFQQCQPTRVERIMLDRKTYNDRIRKFDLDSCELRNQRISAVKSSLIINYWHSRIKYKCDRVDRAILDECSNSSLYKAFSDYANDPLAIRTPLPTTYTRF